MAYMTQEGYDKIVAQIRHMERIDRPAASAAIAEARDKGDLSENSEYDAAKEAQAMLEMKINQLKETIAHAKIIDTSKLSNETVQILSTVEMKNVKNGMTMKYTIVSESEANLREGKISSRTPIAQGLLEAELKIGQLLHRQGHNQEALPHLRHAVKLGGAAARQALTILEEIGLEQ